MLCPALDTLIASAAPSPARRVVVLEVREQSSNAKFTASLACEIVAAALPLGAAVAFAAGD